MQSFLPLKAALLPLCFDPTLDEEPTGFTGYCQLYGLDAIDSTFNVQHRIGSLHSGNHRLAVQYWLPPGALATVLLVHGYYDHIGLYRHVVRFFLEHGYAVLGFDLPGHGLSSGPRAVIHDFDEYGRAIHDVLHLASPGKLPPVVLGFGQSTGCSAWMNYFMAGYPTPVEKLVLFAPLLRPNRWQQQGRWTYEILHRWIKTMPRQFNVNSGDPAFLRFCRKEDPLQPKRLTVDWVGAMKDWIQRFDQQPAIRLPALVVQGQQDTTVDWPYNIPRILQKMPLAQLHYIGEARHHLANESPSIRAHIWQIVDEFLHPPAGLTTDHAQTALEIHQHRDGDTAHRGTGL